MQPISATPPTTASPAIAPPAIAIVGMACRYPDANSPGEFWENILTQRRAFRRMPDERLRLADYYSADRSAVDQIYSTQAAVLKDYAFDRMKFRVSGDTYRQADLTHWLALDVASAALHDAGFPEGAGLDRTTTGVLLGNTLTGEFSRANLMRGRWPYVRRVVEDALAKEGWEPAQRQGFLASLEASYKEPFPEVGTETLAGGLSNTIAGRICNHFDLKGGGYTVDGACASSLLAIANACAALTSGDLDVALAGGVDLSLDPFELVGFARTGALAPDKMRVYDRRSAGFWPGEGCGFVVLMRQADAVAQRRRIYALIRGWGISSDGNGGITRPEVDGQILAVQRAYERAGFGAESVAFFEGHGTGTAVGDATELRTIARARQEGLDLSGFGKPDRSLPAYISTVKGGIGHTKAAAGVAGLIKATLALHHQLLPPTVGHEETHPELAATADNPHPVLQVSTVGQRWPADRPLRAGVSAMGFGGINAHLALEGVATRRRRGLDTHEQLLLASAQDTELFLLSGQSNAALAEQVTQLLGYVARLALAELTDLAAALANQLAPGPVRAAVVAATPAELKERLTLLQAWLAADSEEQLDPRQGIFLSRRTAAPRIGYLFPGQGTRVYLDGGLWERRFPVAREIYAAADLHQYGYQGVETAVAQPAVITAALAGLRLLDQLGIEGDVALGHSLGELAALHWAGAFDEEALLRIAAVRGKAMMDLDHNGGTGTMATIGAGQHQVRELVNGEVVSIACLNAPQQTVISGSVVEVARVIGRAQMQGIEARAIPVSHAFHSPLVAAAATSLADYLAQETFHALQAPVISTVTGSALPHDTDLIDLLTRQITDPVRFTEAVTAAAQAVDLFLEVGPGQTLTQLAGATVATPTIALDAGGTSLRGLLLATGAAYALGANVRHDALFADRFYRPFALDWQASFLVNPCELAPVGEAVDSGTVDSRQSDSGTVGRSDGGTVDSEMVGSEVVESADILTVVRETVAAKIELPLDAVGEQDRLLSDLHINSIAVTQIVAEAAKALGIGTPMAPTEFATLTVADVAASLHALAQQGDQAQAERMPAGVASWVRSFMVDWMPRTRSQREVRKGKAWQLFTTADYPLRAAMQSAFANAGGGGVVLCLPPTTDETHVDLLLQATRQVLTEQEHPRFVVVQHTAAGNNGGAALARTLHLEAPQVATCVIDMPIDHTKAVEWAVAEALATAAGFTEARYDEEGRRWEPVLRLLAGERETGRHETGRHETGRYESGLTDDDVLLVTGGGKGITAECALALAERTGVKLALWGRSQPQADDELATNLNRFTEAGVTFHYHAVDVTDAAAVQAAVQATEAALGPITALLHGAARNAPQSLRTLSEVDFQRTLAPKVTGLRHLLAALDPAKLRLIVGFGSIIARLGLPGEADYAVANDWMAAMLQRHQAAHPHCHTLTIHWSVWAGAGMGERLGTLDGLMRQGITPIPLDQGVAMLQQLLAQVDQLPPTVVVAGRYGTPTTLRVEQPELPFRRFLEQVRVHVPGVELVVDATLSGENDPYMDDHVFRGDRLFLAVLGLEAMAQVAMALTGATVPPSFEQVQFHRPIVVPPGSEVTVRLAALRRENGDIAVVLRSAETGFQADHFQAICRFDEPALAGNRQKALGTFSLLQLDPAQELYEQLFFHKGRFRRVQGYRQVAAQTMVAELSPNDGQTWFGRYLPQELVLGDPGARDATIHAIQVCVPLGTLLPMGVERIAITAAAPTGPRFVHAVERRSAATADTLIFDVTVVDAAGNAVEEWQGLKLKRMDGTAYAGPWSPPVLAPYLERRMQELLPQAPSIALVREPAAKQADRRKRSTEAMQRAIGKPLTIHRRADGQPSTRGKWNVSAAHAGDLTLAVAAPQAHGTVGCDLEAVQTRSRESWQDLLGKERLPLADLVAGESGDAFDVAATRVWGALEALKKAGVALETPLMLDAATPDRWVTFTAGVHRVATYVAQVQGVAESMVATVAMGK